MFNKILVFDKSCAESLHRAVHYGDIEAVRKYIFRANVPIDCNKEDDNAYNVQMHLDHNADIKECYRNELVWLNMCKKFNILALTHEKRVQLQKFLFCFSNQGDFCEIFNGQCNLLTCAIHSSCRNMVEFLLDNLDFDVVNATVTLAEQDGVSFVNTLNVLTLLEYAVTFYTIDALHDFDTEKRLKVIDLLLQRGSKMVVAKDFGESSIIESIVRIIYNCPFNVKDAERAWAKLDKLVTMLLTYNVNVNNKYNIENNPSFSNLIRQRHVLDRIFYTQTIHKMFAVNTSNGRLLNNLAVKLINSGADSLILTQYRRKTQQTWRVQKDVAILTDEMKHAITQTFYAEHFATKYLYASALLVFTFRGRAQMSQLLMQNMAEQLARSVFNVRCNLEPNGHESRRVYCLDVSMVVFSDRSERNFLTEDLCKVLNEQQRTRICGAAFAHSRKRLVNWYMRSLWPQNCKRSFFLREYTRNNPSSDLYKFGNLQVPQCFACLQTNDDVIQLRKCPRCKLVVYCSSKCQRKDWDERHKEICKNAFNYN